MSLITLGIYIAGAMLALGVLVGLLPNGADYPFPTEIETMLIAVVSYGLMFNTILPIQELLYFFRYAATILFISRIIWPSAMWIFKAVTRSS